MTAQQEWEKFAQMVGLNSQGTPEIQRTEMRRAFFAGQFAMFTFQIAEMAAAPDEEAMRMLKARENELNQFFTANFKSRN